MEEREIDLLDLLLTLLLHWRGIVVFMIAGGLALGAFSYVKSGQSVKAQQELLLAEQGSSSETLAERLDTLEASLTETQKFNVLSVIRNEQTYRENEAYLQNSIWMQMDAKAVPEEQIVFGVSAEDLETADAIAWAYENLLGGNGLSAYLTEKFDIDSEALEELYGVSKSSASVANGANSFRVTVVHPEKATCQAMAEAIISYAKEQTEALAGALGEHELLVLGQYYSEGARTDLSDQQKTYQNNQLSLYGTIAKAKDAFAEEEQSYYDLLVKAEPQEEEEGQTEPTAEASAGTAQVSLKYMLVGIVLFAFLYVAIVAIAYIMGSHIRYSDSLQELYGIPQLGQIPGEKSQKKPLQLVDRWILSLWNRNKRQFTAEEAVKLASVAVKIAARKNGRDTLGLIGCDLKAGALSVCEQMKAALEREGVKVEILDNVVYDAEAMERLNDVSAVVLVEKAGVALYSEIEQELLLLKRQNIAVLGGVIEG